MNFFWFLKYFKIFLSHRSNRDLVLISILDTDLKKSKSRLYPPASLRRAENEEETAHATLLPCSELMEENIGISLNL